MDGKRLLKVPSFGEVTRDPGVARTAGMVLNLGRGEGLVKPSSKHVNESSEHGLSEHRGQ